MTKNMLAGGFVVLIALAAATAALLEWWGAAVAALALLNAGIGLGLLILLQSARSNRRVLKSVDTLDRRVENLGVRLTASQESARLALEELAAAQRQFNSATLGRSE